jgi:tRNA (guanine-N7-)-methyltransferase
VEFTWLLARILRPGGFVHHWTDVADYFEMVRGLMDNHEEFIACPPPEERDASHDMDYHTSFERKKRKLGLPIYRALWQRR